MRLFRRDILCPYCLQELYVRDLKMVCPLCETETLPSRGDLFLRRSPRCRNSGCRGFASNRICGHCETQLPSDIMDYEKYLRFSILGITGSGKTSFLTAMLHEMLHSQDSPWVISSMDGRTNEIFQKNTKSIYELQKPVGATIAGIDPPPQLWRIRDRRRMTDRSIPSYSMTIFDGAGEDSKHIDPVISRYIDGSKVLIILIDPLALPSVAKTISKDILNWSTIASHEENASANMVNGLADYIRQNCHIAPGRLIDQDIAVVFTKIDTVRSSFGAATVMQPSPHLVRQGFVMADSDAVDAEIRDWLKSRGESAFLNAIETNFRKVRFFGVSSFGQPPTGRNQLGRVIPHRVVDPLIWMLSKEGIAPAI